MSPSLSTQLATFASQIAYSEYVPPLFFGLRVYNVLGSFVGVASSSARARFFFANPEAFADSFYLSSPCYIRAHHYVRQGNFYHLAEKAHTDIRASTFHAMGYTFVCDFATARTA